MYSLYSSCVSKSQRPRGPFLLPCRERTTQSSSSVAGRASHTALHTQPRGSMSHQPQINGLGSRSPPQEVSDRFCGRGSQNRVACLSTPLGQVPATPVCSLTQQGADQQTPKLTQHPSPVLLFRHGILSAGTGAYFAGWSSRLVPTYLIHFAVVHLLIAVHSHIIHSGEKKNKERIQSGSMRWIRTLELVGVMSHGLRPNTLSS